ncbi:MAG: alcohol dehydrogenase catalytic domain-containing protein [Pseudomonadota bacterium]
MKALVFTAPNEMTYRDEPDAAADRAGWVTVRVSACGICGSDMHAYHGADMVRRPPPLILGHEAAGEIVDGPRAGERVAINPLIPCGKCRACEAGREHVCPHRVLVSMKQAPGAFAEHVVVPARNAVPIPETLAFETAALTEPMAVAYHAVGLGASAAARPLAASQTAVIGGGAIGLCTAQVLESQGARDIMISEPSELRAAAIARGGQFGVYHPASAARPDDDSADVVFDAYGNGQSRAEAFRLVRPGGVIVHIGLAGGDDGVDVRKLTLQEIAFVGSYCYTMVDFRETLDGLARGQFGAFDWLDERPLSAGAEAFKALDAGTVAAAKIILRM